MQILYGVVGEGMGHATRSRVIIQHLLERGHEVVAVASGRAGPFLARAFAEQRRFRVEPIHGLSLVYRGNRMSLGRSVGRNLRLAPAGLVENARAYSRLVDFAPRIVFSDFESWSYFYGLRHDVPVVCVDNMHILPRCGHDASLLSRGDLAAGLTSLAVALKLATADHYLVTSFFFPHVKRPRTTLVPPILRPEILSALRQPPVEGGGHVVVYQTAASNQRLVPELLRLPQEFRVYGLQRSERLGNVTLRQFDEQTFIEDLRTARAVIAGGGFSLMSEAVHLGVPMLSVPLAGQFEQQLNARYLDHLGYGRQATELDAAAIDRFLGELPRFDEALAAYPRRDNTQTLEKVDAFVDAAAAHGLPRRGRRRRRAPKAA